VEEVTDEPLYRDRVCGIDIGKAGLVATIRVPSDNDPARRMAETRSFGTTRREVLALADWLRCWQVPAVVMEATGDYWKGPFYRLEAEGFECVLADARQVKNLPGRPKRDPADSRWLAACFERERAWLFRGSDLKKSPAFGALVCWRWRAGAGDKVA
jgi:transposase